MRFRGEASDGQHDRGISRTGWRYFGTESAATQASI